MTSLPRSSADATTGDREAAVELLSDRLWTAWQHRQVIANYEAWADDEIGPGAGWRIRYLDGADSGPLTLEEAIQALDRLDEETGQADPLLMVGFEECKNSGVLDGYEHTNAGGEAMYGMWTTLADGRLLQHAGDTAAARAALWGMATAVAALGLAGPQGA